MLKMIAAATLATLAFAVPEARDAPVVTYAHSLIGVGGTEGRRLCAFGVGEGAGGEARRGGREEARREGGTEGGCHCSASRM